MNGDLFQIFKGMTMFHDLSNFQYCGPRPVAANRCVGLPSMALFTNILKLLKPTSLFPTRTLLYARHSNRELRRERRDGDHRPAELMNEYRNRRDDRKDLSKEIMEVKKHQKLLDQKRKVAAELFVLQKEIDLAGPRLDSRLQKRQRTLLQRYLELSKQEIKLDLYKTHSDRQELYKDRRETSQDRRHR